MRKVLVTGANGFIGRALCESMLTEGWQIRGAVRSSIHLDNLPSRVNALQVGSIGPDTEWSKALVGIDTVVHLAARVHVINGTIIDPSAALRLVNVNGTERLARETAFANVKRFIYMSSVKVHGEGRSTPYNEEDIQKPQDAYSVSKWESEKVLNEISDETGMELVILRSPLVYGPRVKANFLRLLEIVGRGIPLPLASVNNRRSLIYLGNLVDAIVTCIKNPRASGQTYFVNDGRDLSTPEMIRLMAEAMGRKARLFSFPTGMLKTMSKITGRSAEIDRLVGSFCVDSSKIRTMLGWKPPYTPEEGIRETVLWYKKNGKGQRTDVKW